MDYAPSMAVEERKRTHGSTMKDLKNVFLLSRLKFDDFESIIEAYKIHEAQCLFGSRNWKF